MIPTILTIRWPALSSRAVFWSILCSLTLGAPVLAVGTYIGSPHLSVAGSLAVIFVGGSVCWAGTLRAASAAARLAESGEQPT